MCLMVIAGCPYVVKCNALNVSYFLIIGCVSLEAAEKVPLCIPISCNYFLIVAGFFVSLSY